MTAFLTCDLDSTLYNTDPREQFVDLSKPRDWTEYSMLCVHDELQEGVAQMLRMADAAGVEIHYVTGRMEASRELTEKRIAEDGLPNDGLWMDDSVTGDHISEFGSHAAYKVDRIQRLILSHGGTHILHIDDYASVAVGLSEVGIACICVKTPAEVLENSVGRYV